MPPIYALNTPPNPFWAFVNDLEDHPFFAGPPRRHGRFGPPSPPPSDRASAPRPEVSETAQGKQPTVEDPPEVDLSTIKPDSKQSEGAHGERSMPFRGRGRFSGALENDAEDKECRHEAKGRECRRERHGRPCRGPRGRGDWNGPPSFMFGNPFFGPPWAQRGPPPPPAGPDGPHSYPHTHGPPHHGPPHHRPHHGPPPHARGSDGHGPHHRRQSPPSGPRPGFDLSEFLNKLGGRLGVDLSNAAEGLGLTTDRFTASRTSGETDFEPRADIFENKDRYTIHLSLPGAKKSDIGVDYDGEHSVLRITGVVHRPDVDEQMLSELVVDGRKRETGVFEKAIRLGTKRDPASIDVAGISAKMTDGILVVKISKVEKVWNKREIPIATDPEVDGKADYEDEYSEKPMLFDADEQASVAESDATQVPASKRKPISLIDISEQAEKGKREADVPIEEPKPTKVEEAKQEVGNEKKRATTHSEQLPAYSDHDEEDWEKFSDASGEGEYIKINVD